MNIHPSAASLAGTSRAAARGGEADNQASEAANRQTVAEQPAGKSNDSNALDAGDPTGDRGGDGRQMLDVFEHGQRDQPGNESGDDPDDVQSASPTTQSAGQHLDLEA
jgi:hypothetical protein